VVVQSFKEEKKVSLEMSENEAKFLMFLFQFIGGDPKDTPRKYSDSIRNALWVAGVRDLPSYYEKGYGIQECLVGADPGFRFRSSEFYKYDPDSLT
jgi:hypothetical protein